ncbi:hypothetical protein, variant [Aphanomyces astaci]|uniref:ELMO domain-containing protein n=1 Tax=Aphanomyces astaci TaxID=112090 RepID=W4FSW1_APHAT|nr:hypothetical protein, variant [Aphanomyces astaci]ETV70580.1 hypothetical protein, variant [Aphanomyces astaci]|eukprot:XP_009839963.1 hypothetical protein, variant [Aphanomyces astaci]
MGNQTSTYNPARESAELGRRPNDHELILLFKMQTKFLVRLVECPYHVSLLERYWDSMYGNHASNNHAIPFQRKGSGWRDIGFSTDNPADDIRATGELGLECLVFFVENYPGEARMMNNRQLGYPFVKAAVAVTRVLMEIFHVVQLDGSRGSYPVRDTLYWQLLDSDLSLFRLFAFCFLMFDELFCDHVATTKALPLTMCPPSTVAKLADVGKEKLLATLRRAPAHLTDLTVCQLGQKYMFMKANYSLHRFLEFIFHI